jgi:hypothetical protein
MSAFGGREKDAAIAAIAKIVERERQVIYYNAARTRRIYKRSRNFMKAAKAASLSMKRSWTCHQHQRLGGIPFDRSPSP